MKIKLSKSNWEEAGKKAGWMKLAQSEGEPLTPPLVSNPLNGMKKVKAARIVNDLIGKYTKGFFSDEDWSPISKIWAAFREANLDWTLTSNYYFDDKDSGKSAGKRWAFEIDFINQNGKADKLYGNITASWAGSIKNPSERYDLIAYVN